MLKTKQISTKQVIRALRKMYRQIPDDCSDHSMDKLYRKTDNGTFVLIDNPINDMMGRLMSLAGKNAFLAKAVHIQMKEYDFYDQKDAIRYLQEGEGALPDEQNGYAQAISYVRKDTDDDYFYILLDDNNDDDAVYALDTGSLQGLFLYIRDYYREMGIGFDY